MAKKARITVKQPPLQELKKERSCVKRSCISGCGCLVFLLIFALLFLRIFVLSYPKKIKDVPNQVSMEVPIYHQNSIDTISIISGQKRADMLNKVAFVPKVILSPIIFGYEWYANTQEPEVSKVSKQGAWESFVIAMNTSIVDDRDTVEVRWQDENATAEFIFNYYSEQLKRRGFVLTKKDGGKKKQILFSKEDISGSLRIVDLDATRETDMIILTVSLPN